MSSEVLLNKLVLKLSRAKDQISSPLGFTIGYYFQNVNVSLLCPGKYIVRLRAIQIFYSAADIERHSATKDVIQLCTAKAVDEVALICIEFAKKLNSCKMCGLFYLATAGSKKTENSNLSAVCGSCNDTTTSSFSATSVRKRRNNESNATLSYMEMECDICTKNVCLHSIVAQPDATTTGDRSIPVRHRACEMRRLGKDVFTDRHGFFPYGAQFDIKDYVRRAMSGLRGRGRGGGRSGSGSGQQSVDNGAPSVFGGDDDDDDRACRRSALQFSVEYVYQNCADGLPDIATPFPGSPWDRRYAMTTNEKKE